MSPKELTRTTKKLGTPGSHFVESKVLLKERNFVSEIFTLIFDMERVILQPAKKVRI